MQEIVRDVLVVEKIIHTQEKIIEAPQVQAYEVVKDVPNSVFQEVVKTTSALHSEHCFGEGYRSCI